MLMLMFFASFFLLSKAPDTNNAIVDVIPRISDNIKKELKLDS